MSHRTFSTVQSDSRKAVEAAGTRQPREAVVSAGRWREARGKLPATEVFRPGKTRAKKS